MCRQQQEGTGSKPEVAQGLWHPRGQQGPLVPLGQCSCVWSECELIHRAVYEPTWCGATHCITLVDLHHSRSTKGGGTKPVGVCKEHLPWFHIYLMKVATLLKRSADPGCSIMVLLQFSDIVNYKSRSNCLGITLGVHCNKMQRHSIHEVLSSLLLEIPCFYIPFCCKGCSKPQVHYVYLQVSYAILFMYSFIIPVLVSVFSLTPLHSS